MIVPQDLARTLKSICTLFVGSEPVEKLVVLANKKAYISDGFALLVYRHELELPKPLCVRLDILQDGFEIVELSNNSFAKIGNTMKLLPHCREPILPPYEIAIPFTNFTGILEILKLNIYPELSATFCMSLSPPAAWVKCGPQAFGTLLNIPQHERIALETAYTAMAHTRKVLERLDIQSVTLLVDRFRLCVYTDTLEIHIPCTKTTVPSGFSTIGKLVVQKLPLRKRVTLKCESNLAYLDGRPVGNATIHLTAFFRVDMLERLNGEVNLLYSNRAVMLTNGEQFVISEEVYDVREGVGDPKGQG